MSLWVGTLKTVNYCFFDCKHIALEGGTYEERAIVLVVSRLVGCRGSWREAKFEVPSKIAALC